MFTVYVGVVKIGYLHDFCIQHFFNEPPEGWIVEVPADNMWHMGKELFPQFRLPQSTTKPVVGSASFPLGKITLDGRDFVQTEFLCSARSSEMAALSWVDKTIQRFIEHNKFWDNVMATSDDPIDDEKYWHAARLGKKPEECIADAKANAWA